MLALNLKRKMLQGEDDTPVSLSRLGAQPAGEAACKGHQSRAQAAAAVHALLFRQQLSVGFLTDVCLY